MPTSKRKAKKEKEKKTKHTNSFWPTQKEREDKPTIEEFGRSTFSPPSSVESLRLRMAPNPEVKSPVPEPQKHEEEEPEPESPVEPSKPEGIEVSASSILSVKRPIAQKFAADFSMYLPVLVEATMCAAAEATFCKCGNAQANLHDVEALADNATRKTEELNTVSDAVLAQSESVLEQMRQIHREVKGLHSCPRSLAVHIMVFVLWIVMFILRIVGIVKKTIMRVVGGKSPESEPDQK